jgi:hypothetical protein
LNISGVMGVVSLFPCWTRLAAAGVLGLACLGGSACSSGGSRVPYRYVFTEGRTARVTPDGYAVAPPRAPAAVKRAIQAGNEICRRPYRRGGGHARLHDTAYDCSGSTSYVLNKAGLMKGSMPSGPFRKFGRRGAGRWISVYAREGHVFLVVAGVRFDTSTGRGGGHVGPRWLTNTRSTDRFVVRHPPGL